MADTPSEAGETSPVARRLWWLGLALIVLSRYLAVFDGPWEADEALFSLGVLDFHVPGHRPHPPGFPGFVWSGRVLYWLVGDPLLALRLLSALASVGGLLAMDALLRRLVRPPVAAVTTFAFAMLPGVWAHASRAFTTTPALGLVLLAIYLTVRRFEAGADEPGPWPWLAIAYALCMRPQFVVPVGVLVLAGGLALARRRGLRSVLRPLAWASLGAGIVVGVYALVALDSGGFGPYLTSLRAHAGQHAAALGSDSGLPAFEQLCFVRVMGGQVGLILALGLAAAGAVRSLLLAPRYGLEFGLGLLVMVGVLSASMLWAHHPAFPRYSVVWVAALVPWVALSLDALPGRHGQAVAVGLGLVAAFMAGLLTWPAIQHMRNHALPAVAALDRAVEAGVRQLSHSPGTSPFVRLVAESPRRAIEAGALDYGPPQRRTRTSEGVASLQGDSWILPGATVWREVFEIDSKTARRLGQDRYDQAVLVRQGVVLGADMYRVERNGAGERFVWLAERAELLPPIFAAQPDGEGQVLKLDLMVADDRAPQRVEASCGGRTIGSWTLEAGRTRSSLDLSGCTAAIELEFPDTVARGRDPRPLAMRLVRAWVEGPGVAVEDGGCSLGEADASAAFGLELDGFHNPERFGQRRGRWMSPQAEISLPAEPGEIQVTLARPPFLASEGPFVIETKSERFEGTITDHAMTVTLTSEAPDGRAHLRLSGPSFRPSQRRATSKDERELAAIVYAVARVRRSE